MDSQKPGRRSVSGRTIARRITAAAVRHQLEIAKSNGDDLYEFRREHETQTAAMTRRDGAIAAARRRCETAIQKAHTDYDESVAVALPQQRDALRRMKERGVSEADLSSWTELPVGELRRLLGTSRARPADPDTGDRRARRRRGRGAAEDTTRTTGPRPEDNARRPERNALSAGDVGEPVDVGDSASLRDGQPYSQIGEQPSDA